MERGTIDLGRIEVEASLGPQPGEIVPDFEFATLAGNKTRLSDLRGKYVLIDFWATWCVPCLAKFPLVKKLHEKHESGDKVVVVGMNLDNNLAQARRFLEKGNYRWQQGLLGDWDTSPIPRQFGIGSVPAYLLIDPEGRLVRRSNDLARIAEALKQRLDHPTR